MNIKFRYDQAEGMEMHPTVTVFSLFVVTGESLSWGLDKTSSNVLEYGCHNGLQSLNKFNPES